MVLKLADVMMIVSIAVDAAKAEAVEQVIAVIVQVDVLTESVLVKIVHPCLALKAVSPL